MTSEKLAMIIRRIATEYHRAIVAGETPDRAEQTAFLTVSQEYAGERLYIAKLPKAQKARQIANIQQRAAREIARESGLSLRTVQRLKTGR